MSLYTSLFSGISGLRNHQVMLDVIGNNISNINTIGFKGSRALFAEMFSQARLSAYRPTGENGGVNPQQVGLGASIGAIQSLFTQGNLEGTGSPTDLAVSGVGFFVVRRGGREYLTRVGNFTFDAAGNMVLPSNGAILQGRLADPDGTIPVDAPITNLRFAFDRKAPARATTTVKLVGNLDSGTAVNGTVQTTFQVYDSLGVQHSITVTFTKTSANNWTWDAVLTGTTTSIGNGALVFDGTGTLVSSTGTPIAFTPTNGANPVSVTLNAGTPNQFGGITQTSGSSLVSMRDQDGYASGTLESILVEKDGKVQGKFSNGTTITLGQIILAELNNPGGMYREGDGLYSVTGNSGNAAYVIAGEGSSSEIVSGVLEQSSVDLAEEFTRMIVAQRGYQSNARIITVTDEILQETINLRR
ncbi:MAG TPA: flagellar hook protein FlgE [Bacteroidota bacterium]|nr:flagellar hook protein FlgE [Bacteroidota bacterium]